jgi:hypothetical protein
LRQLLQPIIRQYPASRPRSLHRQHKRFCKSHLFLSLETILLPEPSHTKREKNQKHSHIFWTLSFLHKRTSYISLSLKKNTIFLLLLFYKNSFHFRIQVAVKGREEDKANADHRHFCDRVQLLLHLQHTLLRDAPLIRAEEGRNRHNHRFTSDALDTLEFRQAKTVQLWVWGSHVEIERVRCGRSTVTSG